MRRPSSDRVVAEIIRDVWKVKISSCAHGQDAVRTDRDAPAAFGNIRRLTDILVTHSLDRGAGAYAQGLTDLLFPLLCIFENEV